MKHEMMAAVCGLLLLCTLTGCQLAQENAGADSCTDRMIGVFLTTKYLDLSAVKDDCNENLRDFHGGDLTLDGNAQNDEGRLYAALTTRTLTNEETGKTAETEEYVFPDTPGIAYFAPTVSAIDGRESYTTSISDPAISDGHISVNVGDEANSTILEGTIYVSPASKARTYYFNPVYQSADGGVYLTAGSGFTVNSDSYSEGSVYSQKLDATTTVTENGKVKTESMSMKLSISTMFTPEDIVILQMDTDSRLLLRTEYKPHALPEAFAPEAGTAYFIVETYKRDDTGSIKISREIYSRDAQTIDTFSVRADGICVKQGTQIKWPESVLS